MKKEERLIKAYGKNEAGLADIPKKVSGTFISRIKIGDECGCSFCFPHGIETYNSHYKNEQRNWKKYRKKQWIWN
jgi:hypothetical protein